MVRFASTLILYTVSVGNHMNVCTIKDLLYEWYLKICSKLHWLLGKHTLKEFSNITSSLEISNDCSFIK